jgi:hypothetical protein
MSDAIYDFLYEILDKYEIDDIPNICSALLTIYATAKAEQIEANESEDSDE